MAAVAAASQLTEAHRLAQGRLGAQTVSQMRAIWALLDPEDLDGTFERWLRAAMPIIDGQRVASTRLAANYLTAFKAIELGPSAQAGIVLASPAAPEAVTTSLLVTGPVSVKRAMTTGALVGDAMSTAEANTARAAMRHVLAGGRDTIDTTVRSDRQALGWARATSGRPCHFCAMLASRGPVYKGEDTAGFQAHDGCSCTVEPVYRRDAAWPAGSQQWADLWKQAKDAGGDTTNEFRRLVAAA